MPVPPFFLTAFHVAVLSVLLLFPGAATAEGPSPAAESVEEGLQHANAKFRAMALQQLLKHPDLLTPELYPDLIGMLDDAVRVIVPVLGSESRDTELQTPGRLARNILRSEGTNCLEELQVALLNQRPSIRWRCAELLGQLDHPDSLDALVGVLMEDSDRLVQITAADALVSLGVSSLPRVMEMFSHPDIRIRRHAIYVASKVGDQRVIEPLLELATATDRPDSVQARQALLGLSEDIMDPILEMVEGDRPVPVKLRAIKMAGQLRAPSALEALTYIVLTHANEQLRIESLRAIAASPLPDFSFHPILNLVTDPNPLIAGAAPGLLRRFAPELLEQMLFYIENTEEPIQQRAVLNLTSIGAEGNPLLVKAMNLPGVSRSLKLKIAEALKRTAFFKVNPEDRIEALILLEDWPVLIAIGAGMEQRFLELYGSRNPVYRRGALRYYGTSGNESHFDLLIDALDDPDDGVRAIAQEAILYAAADIQPNLREKLGRGIGHRSTLVPALLKRMRYRHRSEIEQLQIAVGIGDWRSVSRLGKAALTYLLEMLEDEDAEVALWASKALADFHTNIPLKNYGLLTEDPTLYEVLRVGGTRDNQVTLNTLQALGDQRSVAYLLCGWFSDNEETRAAANRTLLRTAAGGRKLMKEGLKARDADTRDRFINLIAGLREPQFDLLLPHLDRDDPLSASIIEALGTHDYIPKTDNEKVNYLVAAEAYKQASRLGDLGVNRLLEEAEKRPGERAHIIRALAGAKATTLIPYYLLHSSSTDPAVAQASRYALEALGTEAISTLMAITLNGNITQAKGAARWLLDKQLISPETDQDQAWLYASAQLWKSASEAGETYQKSLRPFLTHSQVNRRAISAAGLAGLRELHTYAQLKRQREMMLENNVSLSNNVAEIRAAAAIVIAARHTNAVETIDSLVGLLADDTELRPMQIEPYSFNGRKTPGIQAAFALSRMGEPGYSALLHASTNLTNSTSAENGKLGIALVNHPVGRIDQLALISGSDSRYAELAAGSLAQRRDLAALPFLVRRAMDPSSPARHRMKQLLTLYGDQALDALLRGLEGSYTPEQVPEYLVMLERVPSARTVPYLADFMTSDSLPVRRATLRVLGKIGNEEAIRVLLDATKAPLWIVREVASAELIQLGTRSVPQLLDALEHPERAGAGYPARLLPQITTVNHGEDIAAWRSWWSRRSAQAAPEETPTADSEEGGSLDTEETSP